MTSRLAGRSCPAGAGPRVARPPGGGVPVVVETVGADTWQTSLGVCRPGGRVCVCGATSGPNPPANLHRMWWKQLTILGSTMGTREGFEGGYDLGTSGP